MNAQHLEGALFLPLTFEDVPVVEPGRLSATLQVIDRVRRGRKRSYGAYIVRQATDVDRAKALAYLKGFKDERHTYESDVFNGIGYSMLHTDGGPRNGVTVHDTSCGSVDFVLLVGSMPIRHSSGTPLSQEARNVFDVGIVDTAAYTPPIITLRSVMHGGDLLIFDHSQPHIFRNVTPDRVSTAHYLTLPEP